MKIQLDYDEKVITLENDVNLGEFYAKIKTLLPDWKKWGLNTQTTINWTNPITIPYYPRYNPWWEYQEPYYRWHGTSGSITTNCDGNNHTLTDGKITDLTSGTYCLELN